MANLIPIFTFLLAIIFRMKKLDLRKSSSQAKSLGAIVAVTGAFIVTLYKGPPLWMISSTSDSPLQLLLSQESDWIIGGLLLVLVFIGSATWNVVQAATVMDYPEEMTIVFFFTFFITIQAGIFCVIVERNLNAWKLRTNVEIIAIVCQAIFGSLFRISVHTWCLRKKGPVYVAMFKPLGMVVALVLTVIFLGYTPYLGRYIIYIPTLFPCVTHFRMTQIIYSKWSGRIIKGGLLQCGRRHCNCIWILHCDVGTNEGGEDGFGE
ncbi:hypothetical protein Ddye_000413 [Dipteronia dyeriana]|uniref:WAT1-related protein n=1 Tax=Dipteronia dyeriana TaxID=168575 RepID=A0AAE0CSK7_9ROSI|nr:hypothetical protein Ddye_000413 [Dipteronia dyeriana]